jgi:hypothetical protein
MVYGFVWVYVLRVTAVVKGQVEDDLERSLFLTWLSRWKRVQGWIEKSLSVRGKEV